MKPRIRVFSICAVVVCLFAASAYSQTPAEVTEGGKPHHVPQPPKPPAGPCSNAGTPDKVENCKKAREAFGFGPSKKVQNGLSTGGARGPFALHAKGDKSEKIHLVDGPKATSKSNIHGGTQEVPKELHTPPADPCSNAGAPNKVENCKKARQPSGPSK